MRMQYFWEQRALPRGFIPGGAQERALQQRDALRQKSKRQTGPVGLEAAATETSTPAWVEIGPKPLGTPWAHGISSGRVTSLAVDPRNNDVVYLGAADGGVWKTTDGGLNWKPLTDIQPSLSIGAIAIAPSAPDTIYVGTGEGNFAADNYYGIGILKSTDGGATWTNYTGPFGGPTGVRNPSQVSYHAAAHIGAVAVKPDDASVVLAAAQLSSNPVSGIYRSVDGGMNWTLVLGGAPGTQVVFDAAQPTLVYAAIGLDAEAAHGIYKSVDAGQTWTRLTGLNTALASTVGSSYSAGRIALAVAPGNPNFIVASIEDNASATAGNLLGVFKSEDGGFSWSHLQSATDTQYCKPQCWYDNVVAISPTDSNLMFLGGAAGSQAFVRSTDGGQTWSSAVSSSTGTLHVDHHALAFTKDGTRLYSGNDGGVWKTEAPAGSIRWQNLNLTLGTIQFYPGMSIHPADPLIAYAGAQDNGTNKYTGSLQWEGLTPCGDGGWTAIDPTNTDIVYTACQNRLLYRSYNAGDHWISISGEIETQGDRVLFIAPLVIDVKRPNTLYFGTNRLWQTINNGTTWTPISNDVTGSSTAKISCIGVSPVDSNRVYVGTSNGRIMTTTTALSGPSATWGAPGTGLPGRYVTSVVPDPVTPSVAYATVSGFSYPPYDLTGHVFKTTNGGLSWFDISGDLPNTPANEIVVDPDIPSTLYAATDVGVFKTQNGGQNWVVAGAGLPNSAVVSLKLHRASRTLRAATHGRGAWDLSVPAGTVTLTPSSANFGTAKLGSTTSGQLFTFANSTGVAVTINTIQIDSADFAFTTTCGTTVAPLASCTIEVTFKPLAAGARSSYLVVQHSGPGSPHRVSLSGTGEAIMAPVVSLSAATVSFSPQRVRTTSAARVVFVTNSGSASLSFQSISATGDFVQFNDCPEVLAAGSSCSLYVLFRPQATGERTGQLTLTTNATGSPHAVSLSGSGTAGLEGPRYPSRPGRTTEPAPQQAPSRKRLSGSSVQ